MPEISVTTHAVVRWLERVEGWNLSDYRKPGHIGACSDGAMLSYLERLGKLTRDGVRGRILSDTMKALILMGAKAIPLPCGCTVIVTSHRIVTVLAPGQRQSKKPRKRRRARAKVLTTTFGESVEIAKVAENV